MFNMKQETMSTSDMEGVIYNSLQEIVAEITKNLKEVDLTTILKSITYNLIQQEREGSGVLSSGVICRLWDRSENYGLEFKLATNRTLKTIAPEVKRYGIEQSDFPNTLRAKLEDKVSGMRTSGFTVQDMLIALKTAENMMKTLMAYCINNYGVDATIAAANVNHMFRCDFGSLLIVGYVATPEVIQHFKTQGEDYVFHYELDSEITINAKRDLAF